jgi:parallel beta-helix repeat protein
MEFSGPPLSNDLSPRVAPIWINEASDFGDFASRGTGTSGDPFILEGYHFASNRSALIVLTNTSASFIIRNFSLHGNTGTAGGYPGIVLDNVTNGLIANNVFRNCSKGISLVASESNTLEGNTLLDSPAYGIELAAGSRFNTLDHNTITYATAAAIHVFTSNNNSILRNTITLNPGLASHGIALRGESLTNCTGNLVVDNTIVDNGEAGISLTLFCYYNNLTANKILNGSTGLNFYTSTGHNFVRGNTITGTTGKGIFLWVDSDANAFYYNTVANSTDYGLYLDNSCEKNVVICNYFLDNKPGGAQAYDDGPTNTFEYNHWNDWITPDANSDGIVDVPYDLAGTVSNQDPLPQVYPYDVIAPVIALASPPNNAFVSPTTPIQLHITDNYPLIPVTVWYSWDGGANSTSRGPYVLYCPPTETNHTVQVWAEDAGGNQATPKTFTFRVDATPPTITLASATQPTLGQSSAQIQFTITDMHPIITALYKWGNATTNSTLLAPSYTLNFSATEGPQTLYVFAEDEVGNWGTYSGTPPRMFQAWRTCWKFRGISVSR